MGATWLGSVQLPKPLQTFFFALAIVEAFVGHAYAIDDPLTSQLILTRETHFLRTWMHDRKDATSSLIVYDRPGQFTAFGFGAVDYDYFRAHTTSIQQNLRDGLYPEIYILQHRSLNDGKIINAYQISPLVQLNELAHYEISESEEVVISSMVHPIRIVTTIN
jgi:hypothetical protein